MDAIYRYPGITPFSEKDQGVFFGRDADIERLYNSILLNQCTVIAGKSGIGKTSLIYAGLKPRIEKKINNTDQDERYFTILPVRVGVWTANEKSSDKSLTLIDKVKQFIGNNPAASTSQEFLAQLPQELKKSLWYKLKQLQFETHDKPNQIFLLIFDQLEELFTYPFAQFKELLNEFKEIMTNNLPDAVREAIEDIEPGEECAFTGAELRIAYNALPVKLLLAIRSDKLNLLNRLREAIPMIYQNPVEIRPLSREQAGKAIREPASKNAKAGEEQFEFKTDPFEIEEDTVNQICTFLENQTSTDLDSNFEDWRIEPFTLQIICQHIERNIVPSDQDKKISTVELGDPDEIIKNYYEDVLNKLQLDEKTKQNVRKLIEEEMIYEPDQRRLILYKEIIIKEYDITEELLNKLSDAKLLRELTAASSKSSYEISHDWMVIPILNAKKERLGLSNAQKFGGTILLLEEQVKKNPNDYSLYKRIGDYYYFVQEFNTAISKYSQAIRKKEQLAISGSNLELYLNRADSYLKLEDYKSSIKDLKVVLEIEPKHLLANYYMAYNYHMSRQNKEAQEFYLKVIDIDATYSNAYHNLGLVCENMTRLEESYQYFVRTTELNPKDYEAYYRLGLLTALKMHKAEEAVRDFNKSIELNPDFEDAYVQLAYVYHIDLIQPENAIATLNLLVQRNPQNKMAWTAFGIIYGKLKNYQEAIRSLYKSISIDPKDPEVFYQLSALSNEQGKYKNAVSFAVSCLQLNPYHVNVYLQKGYAHRMLQQVEESISCYKKILEIDPKNETAARSLEVIDEYDDETELLKAIEQNPADASSLLRLGILANNKEKFGEAIDYFKKILEVEPKHIDSRLEMAYAYSAQNEMEKSIEIYKEIIELKPADPTSYFSIGKIYEFLNKLDEAIYYFEKTVEVDSSEQDAYYHLGVIANNREEYEKAINSFDHALQIKPDNINALLEKSFALNQLSRFEEAFGCCKTILTYDPNHAQAYYIMGKTYIKLNQIQEAATHLLKSTELSPMYYEAYYELGVLAHGVKNYADAITFFERCAAIEPGKVDAYNYLAYYSMQAKDYETAAKHYKKLVEIAPQKATWHYNLGLALKEINNPEQALIHFKNTVALDSNDSEALYNIGKICEQMNNKPEAIKYYEQAIALNPDLAQVINK